MATQENNPGLLVKVARFVRNPTTDWADLDKPEGTPAIDNSKDALKLVIERKRHDDGVRKREFNQLRKLRQASPVAKAELAQNPSSFRSTSGGIDDVNERATTLKKIDDIEAQMSHQWWKGRSSAGQSTADSPVGAASEPPEDFPSTQSSRLSSTAQGEVTQMSGPAAFDFQSTEAGVPPSANPGDADEASRHGVLSHASVVSVDLGQNLSDPEMEEAAVRYANGDDAGAEAALQTALLLPDAKPEMVEAWAAALLDLYRSTGQLANFERMALNYARRFGRSAPAWAAVSPPMTAVSAALPKAAVPAGRRWDSPVELDDAAVARLRDVVRASTNTIFLNWHPVQRMTASAAKNLADVWASWCRMPVSLCFEGVDSLTRLLSAHTPGGDRSTPEYFWQLRFDALRTLRMQDDYELAALDFCVTFEVSPPPWQEPVCQRVSGPQAASPASPGRAMPLTSAAHRSGATKASGSHDLVLSGDVRGDVSGIVAQWQTASSNRRHWLVSCTGLIRVDFSAAGGLLNWVTHASAQGGRVEFYDVPRLVAAFFHLIGINEHAKVTARTN